VTVSDAALWHVYILLCADGTLYTGVAKDVNARLLQHGSGKGARYTRARLPLELVYHHEIGSQGDALRREAEIKRMPRAAKEALIAAWRAE
jgi:putative endonuclease